MSRAPLVAVTPTMREALEHAKAHGGELVRSAGGFWHEPTPGTPGFYPARAWFGTPTIEALVRRGLMEYVEWKEGRSGRFPVRAEIVNICNKCGLRHNAPTATCPYNNGRTVHPGTAWK